MILYDPCYRPAEALPILQHIRPLQPAPPFPLDAEIVNFLQGQPEAVSTWKMVNEVATAQHPVNRTESRELKKRILARITPLIYTRRIRRVGRNFLTLR